MTLSHRPLRIAILGKSNHIGGGASKVSELMLESLIGLGHSVDRFTVHKPPTDPGGRSLFGPKLSRATWLIHSGCRRLFGGEFLPVELPALRDWPSQYDIVHVNDHFVSVSPWTIAWLADRIPTVLTLNDSSYFTGGCLYPYECVRFEIGCGQCPQQGSMRMPVDVTRPSLLLKKSLLRERKIALLAPSQWMADQAALSLVIPERPEVLPYGIRRHIFHPGRRKAAREKFGLGADEKVVLIGASSLADTRKGVPFAVEAVNLLPEPRPTVLLLGHAAESLKRILRTRSIDVGFLEVEEDLADVYAAADLFAFPSLADNLPLSVIESLACGTPVICFDRGGTPELIRSARDGEVLTEVSASSLANAMTNWLQHLPASDEQRQSIADATDTYSLERQGRDLIAVYERMLHARNR